MKKSILSLAIAGSIFPDTYWQENLIPTNFPKNPKQLSWYPLPNQYSQGTKRILLYVPQSIPIYCWNNYAPYHIHAHDIRSLRYTQHTIYVREIYRNLPQKCDPMGLALVYAPNPQAGRIYCMHIPAHNEPLQFMQELRHHMACKTTYTLLEDIKWDDRYEREKRTPYGRSALQRFGS